MFKNPFSFEGRIRRLEYGLSKIIIFVGAAFIGFLAEGIIKGGGNPSILLLFAIPIYWLGIAQAVKRSHDVGNSGWCIFIPFYGLFLLFAEGEAGTNKWGENPKGVGNTSQSGGGFTPPNNPQYPTGGYQNGNNFGGHNGGYNNQQQGTRFYNGGYNAPQTPPQQGGGFYNGGHNANPQQWQQQGQQPQGGGFYNGGHNANNQPNNSPQRQPQQTPPQPKRGDGKDFDGNLYGKAN